MQIYVKMFLWVMNSIFQYNNDQTLPQSPDQLTGSKGKKYH